MTMTVVLPHTSSATDRFPVTAEGLSILKDRLRYIDDVRLPQLRALLVDRDRDERDVSAYARLVGERDELSATIDLAEVIRPVQARRALRLGLGMRARVCLPDGSRVWVRPVHPVEAHLDDERISMDSPLARAILGSRRGDVVEVVAPSGSWTCKVLSIEPQRDDVVGSAA